MVRGLPARRENELGRLATTVVKKLFYRKLSGALRRNPRLLLKDFCGYKNR
jgi:hypothetical protein